MSRPKLARGLVVDAFLLIFWLAVFFVELLFIQDLIWTVIALICVFLFSALLGRDIRRRGAQ